MSEIIQLRDYSQTVAAYERELDVVKAEAEAEYGTEIAFEALMGAEPNEEFSDLIDPMLGRVATRQTRKVVDLGLWSRTGER